jgi:signal transduction histidine kinase
MWRRPIPAAPGLRDETPGRRLGPELTPMVDRKASPGRTVEIGKVLLAISVLLPLVVLVLAAAQGRREAIRETHARVERTTHILHEHAVKVFETHRLVIEEVNERLRGMDWSREADRASLHSMLARLSEELDQVATITITDPEGRLRASSRIYPADPTISFADRDWYLALRQSDPRLPYVSRPYVGRQSQLPIFNIAGRVRGSDPTAFHGAIAVSVDRPYFEEFYRGIEPDYEITTVLARSDGFILARYPNDGREHLGDNSPLLSHAAKSPVGLFTSEGSTTPYLRIFGYRKIGDYPVYVGFGISERSALAQWRTDLVSYGVVAALASFALLALSGLAIREQGREREATRRWRDSVLQLQAEAASREKVEEQLRQSQKMEAVGRLTGGLAHDFNNLLTIVIGNLDLLKRRLSDGEPRARHLLEQAADGAQRAATLTHRLLAFARQQPLAPTIVSPNDLISGMWNLLTHALGEHITIDMRLDATHATAMVDANQLESALLNLVVNARDAMPRGGTVTIETAAARMPDDDTGPVRPDLAPGDYVVIAVADTGIGMDEEARARAVEPFFTTKPVGKGTGLGLSQVYGFAKQSKGDVTIASAPEAGTTVRLYLPRCDSGAAFDPALGGAPLPADDPLPRSLGAARIG